MDYFRVSRVADLSFALSAFYVALAFVIFVIMVVLDASTLILIAKAELLDLFLTYVSVPVAIPEEVERNPVDQKSSPRRRRCWKGLKPRDYLQGLRNLEGLVIPYAGGSVTLSPKPIDFDGVCPLLQVFDMPTSVKFYREVLGFELVGNSPIVHGRDGDYFHWCMLRRGGTTIMLNTAYDEGERPPAPDAARFAAHSDTALFFGCPDVDAAYALLLPLGVNVLEKPFTTVYDMRRFTIADPDGYNLCFQGPVVAD